MTSWAEGSTRTLEWVQPRWTKRSYELKAGGELIATLQFVGALSGNAEAKVGSASYWFTHSGIVHRKIMMTKAPFDQEVGEVELRWTGAGTVKLVNGRVYELVRPSMWRHQWKLSDGGGEEIAFIKVQTGRARYKGEVSLSDKGSGDDMTMTLLAIAWYVISLTLQNEAAAVASGGG
jgi:hypothetical protein